MVIVFMVDDLKYKFNLFHNKDVPKELKTTRRTLPSSA